MYAKNMLIYAMLCCSLASYAMLPLHEVVKDVTDLGDLIFLERLIDEGADVLRLDGLGQSALHVAARIYRDCSHNCLLIRAVIELLIARSPRLLDLQDYNGNTALMDAAFNGNETVVRCLLALNANPCKKNKIIKRTINCHGYPESIEYERVLPYEVVTGNKALKQLLILAAVQRETSDGLVTFLLSGHKRVGVKSSARFLCPDLRKLMCTFVVPRLAKKSSATLS